MERFEKKYVVTKINEFLDDDHRMEHTAPNEDCTPIHKLYDIYPDDIYSYDASRLYGDHSQYYSDNESISILQSVKDRPNMLVKIYRAVPNLNSDIDKKIKKYGSIISYYHKFNFFPRRDEEMEEIYLSCEGNYNEREKQYYDKIVKLMEELNNSKLKPIKIKDGDWITINKDYAKDHGRNNLKNNFKIITKTVRAKNIYTDANSIHEFGYVENP